MKDFILSHLKEIVLVFLILLELVLQIVAIFVKSKKKNPAIAFVLNRLPSIINSVEGRCLTGREKKKLVLSIARDLFEKEAGCEITTSIFNLIDDAIEDILSTPQKKGETDA